jgi:hypothetical protein
MYAGTSTGTPSTLMRRSITRAFSVLPKGCGSSPAAAMYKTASRGALQGGGLLSLGLAVPSAHRLRHITFLGAPDRTQGGVPAAPATGELASQLLLGRRTERGVGASGLDRPANGKDSNDRSRSPTTGWWMSRMPVLWIWTSARPTGHEFLAVDLVVARVYCARTSYVGGRAILPRVDLDRLRMDHRLGMSCVR